MLCTLPAVVSVKIRSCIITVVAVIAVIGVYLTAHSNNLFPRRTLSSVVEYERSVENTLQRIFFHDTSGNNYLDTRQTCAVESAAMHNPHRTIQLFMHGAEKPHECSPWYRVLAKYRNIQIVLVNSSKFFAGTPLEKWYEATNTQLHSLHDDGQLDAVRFLSLYNGGGILLDFDFIVLKPFHEGMRDFFVYQDHTGFTHAALHVKAKHPLLKRLLAQLASDCSDAVCRRNSQLMRPRDNLLTRVVREFCGFGSHSKRNGDPCPDFKLYPPSSFIPIDEKDLASIYYYNINFDEIYVKLKDSYALRTWGKLARRYPVTFDMKQTFALVAAQNCPITVSVASENA